MDPNANVGWDLHLFRPPVDSKGLLTLNGTDILGSGDLSFGLVADLGAGLMRVGSRGQGLIGTYITGTFHANLGIGNVLVLGAQLPIHLVSGPANDGTPTMGMGPTCSPTMTLGINPCEYDTGPRGLDYQGPGDVILHAKLRWLRGEYYPVGLAVLLQVGLPLTSGTRRFAGEPGPWVWPSIAIDRRIGRQLRLAANLGLRLPFGTGASLTPAADNGGATLTYGPSLTFGLGLSYRVVSVLDLLGEVYGAQYVNGFGNVPASTNVEAVLGAKVFVERNSYLTLGVGPGLTGVAGASVRAFLGFIFEPSIGDTDGDGYRDDVDRCVLEPEDFDNFEDEDGCPDPDNDRDGILDVDDQCPLVPEDRNGRNDDDGCPDSEVQDRDGDQLADNVDRCPDDPEDRDGFEDDDGCPDLDNDRDGILDTDDLCPNDPEDRDGFEDDNGCPDPDNDQDRIPDVRDQCPNEPETYNGLDDEDGCPDNGVIRRVGDEIRFNRQILFETDSAQIVDSEENREILEQLSRLLNETPEIELIEVEGHTDERAPDDHNLQLSRDRANSVMQALVQRRVAPGRMVPAGYGEYCPIDPGHTEDAWRQNRRVQVFIIRTADTGRTTAVAGCPRGRQYIPSQVGPPRRGN
jgi:outer membrane protein OmpA-like peptidoglycan-associated protein